MGTDLVILSCEPCVPATELQKPTLRTQALCFGHDIIQQYRSQIRYNSVPVPLLQRQHSKLTDPDKSVGDVVAVCIKFGKRFRSTS